MLRRSQATRCWPTSTEAAISACPECPESPELTSLSHRVGAPKNWPFDHWITPTRKIVVVSIYYRLSVIGFLSHPRLVESGLGDLNVGIQDQIQALRWIQANVSKFGGDPSKMSAVVRRANRA